MEAEKHSLEPAWEALRRDFDAALKETVRADRRQLLGELSSVCRRLRQYENEEQWLGALRDGIALGAHSFAVLTLADCVLRLRHQQQLDLPETSGFAVSSAKAFAAAIESRDQVVALRTPDEVGEQLSSSGATGRAHLFPVANGKRVVAIVFAVTGDSLDVSLVELVSGVAATVLERQSNQSIHSQITLSLAAPVPVSAQASEEPVRARSLPGWADLNEKDRILHSRAQRFSRVAVADMQLRKPEACRSGRKQNNMYMFLQTEIEKARETYSKQFMTIASMVDYLHLELVNVAAEGDERKLGADYPGHLV